VPTAPAPFGTTHELRDVAFVPQFLITTGAPSALLVAVRQLPVMSGSTSGINLSFNVAPPSSPAERIVWNLTVWPALEINKNDRRVEFNLK
jgi:hypothetical protein